MHLTSQAWGLVNCSPLGFASLPTHVIFKNNNNNNVGRAATLVVATYCFKKGCHVELCSYQLWIWKKELGYFVRIFCSDAFLEFSTSFWFGCWLGNLFWISCFWRAFCCPEHFLKPSPWIQLRELLLIPSFCTYHGWYLFEPENRSTLKAWFCFGVGLGDLIQFLTVFLVQR